MGMSSSSSDDDDDPKLPHDVAVEVLKRLPAESLLRFRCVCRSWRSTIDDPRSVGLHLTHSAVDASNWHLVSLDWRDPLQYTWRSLECEVSAFCGSRPAFFLNGNLHWFAPEFDDLWEETGYGSIVWLDVAGEVFDEMALPEEILHMDNGGLLAYVAVVNDLLAVFINIMDAVLHPEPHSISSVWVMREYGVPKSWTKLYSFEACGLVTGFDGFTRNGEPLMDIDDEERVSWDPIMGQYTNLELSTHCDLVIVVESRFTLEMIRFLPHLLV